MAHIPQSEERYLRAPELTPREDGATLRCIAWATHENAERVVSFALDGEGEPTLEGSADPEPAIVWLGSDDSDASPDRLAGRDLEARCGDYAVSVLHREQVAEVRVRMAAGEFTVWRASGSASAPTLALAPGGCWVAWHHDVREEERTADVAKWIALRFVSDAGEVFEPRAEMTDRDRDRAGEEQSFEFPRLVVGDDGAVAVFGRGSHNFWRQDLNSGGWHPRAALGEGEWGSRGRWCAACALPDGRIVTARRERRAIQIDVLDGATGGAPELVPAEVDWTHPASIAPRARRQRVRRRRDPARRHGLSTFFGDIQQHSAHSDGVGSADEVYLRARHRYEDDFVALTDHESFLGKRTGPGEWEYLKQVADRHTDPGRFVGLIAYEWTGKMYPGPGHKCVYLPRRDQPIVSRDDVPEGRELVRAIAEMGGMASPHHIGWTGCDESGHDPSGQPTWEICSCHGCYEHADHPLGARGEHEHQLVDVMLGKGHRFGFTASSDSHGLLWHHGESRKRDPYRTGLTAVQATTLTRTAVFTALRTRRCYATSGVKILLDVSVNGAPMGSVVTAGSPVTLRARAIGTGPLARVEWVGPDGVVAEGAVDGETGRIETKLALSAYAYLRVVQEDGEMAWSSPVFNDAAS